jgi:hypothetical protein
MVIVTSEPCVLWYEVKYLNGNYCRGFNISVSYSGGRELEFLLADPPSSVFLLFYAVYPGEALSVSGVEP